MSHGGGRLCTIAGVTTRATALTVDQHPRTASADSVAHAYGILRAAILDGRLVAGTIVVQQQLAETLNVSRTPLREALRLLQMEGLIDAEANKQMRVTPITLERIEELFVMRIPLDVIAVRVAVDRMTKTDLLALDRYEKDMRELSPAGSTAAWERAHTLFHQRLTRSAGERMADVCDMLVDHCGRYTRPAAIPGHPRMAREQCSAVLHEEHRQLVEACAARDCEHASDLIGWHHVHVVRMILHSLDPGYECTMLARLEGRW
jgi:DNA-binding GntR family transcriptional regulator